jgi:hypothetical protein
MQERARQMPSGILILLWPDILRGLHEICHGPLIVVTTPISLTESQAHILRHKVTGYVDSRLDVWPELEFDNHPDVNTVNKGSYTSYSYSDVALRRFSVESCLFNCGINREVVFIQKAHHYYWIFSIVLAHDLIDSYC